MRSRFLRGLAGCGLALAAVSVHAGSDDDEWLDVAVYVDDADWDSTPVRLACKFELGRQAPDNDVVVTSPDGIRGRLLVYRLKARHSWARGRANRLRRERHVADSFVNELYRARGAPTQIPTLDGDLEPRVIFEQPAMSRVRMGGAQAISRGAGKVVAVLDGGFDLRHECLQGRVHGQRFDFVEHDPDPQDLGNGVDDDEDGVTDLIVGHGTLTSSLILAAAPDATILPIRVLDDEGWGTPVWIVEAVNHAVAAGADVINMSLVIPVTTEAVRDAIRAALDAGVVVVSSAGNGPTWQNDPLLASRMITVGATDGPCEKADFSVTGYYVHVYAPGVEIVGGLGGRAPNDYAHWQGTSFSAPFVSATAAMLRSANPSLSPESVRSRLMENTAGNVDGASPSSRGELDAQRVLESAGN